MPLTLERGIVDALFSSGLSYNIGISCVNVNVNYHDDNIEQKRYSRVRQCHNY